MCVAEIAFSGVFSVFTLGGVLFFGGEGFVLIIGPCWCFGLVVCFLGEWFAGIFLGVVWLGFGGLDDDAGGFMGDVAFLDFNVSRKARA